MSHLVTLHLNLNQSEKFCVAEHFVFQQQKVLSVSIGQSEPEFILVTLSEERESLRLHKTLCQETTLGSDRLNMSSVSLSPSVSAARSIGLMRPLKDVTVTAGETATFECELSYEGIAVDWFLGGKKMEASERVRQTFSMFPARKLLHLR